jgi:hypothetical protein
LNLLFSIFAFYLSNFLLMLFRLPVTPSFDRDVYGKRIDQLSIQQVRNNYRFDRQVSDSIFANFFYFLLVSALTFPTVFLKWTKVTYLVLLGKNLERLFDHVVRPPLKFTTRILAKGFNFILENLKWKKTSSIITSITPKPNVHHQRTSSTNSLQSMNTETH